MRDDEVVTVASVVAGCRMGDSNGDRWCVLNQGEYCCFKMMPIYILSWQVNTAAAAVSSVAVTVCDGQFEKCFYSDSKW